MATYTFTTLPSGTPTYCRFNENPSGNNNARRVFRLGKACISYNNNPSVDHLATFSVSELNVGVEINMDVDTVIVNGVTISGNAQNLEVALGNALII